MKIYLSENRILLFLLCSIYTYIFISISELPWSMYVLSQILCAGFMVLYLMANLDIYLMKKYRVINGLVLLYSILALVSVYLNGQFSIYQISTFALNNTILPFIEIQREKGHFYFLCKVMLFWLSLLILVNDVLMVIMPGRFYGDGLSKTFFLDNKFATGYDHILMFFLFCILIGEKKKKRRWIPVLFVIICLICYYIDCNTAILGTVVFFLISHSSSRLRDILSRKSTMAVMIALSAMFIWSGDMFRIRPVKFFITEVLGRDVTLTGRQQIYDIVPRLLLSRPWIGYGNSAGIISKYTGAFNAQNGFFDLAISYGIPAALVFVILLITLVRRPVTTTGRYALGTFYGFLVMSTVEMTFGSMMMLFGMILFTDSSKYSEKKVKLIDWGGGSR